MLPARIRFHIVTGMSMRPNQCGDERAALWELMRRMARRDEVDRGCPVCGRPLMRDVLDQQAAIQEDHVAQGGGR